MVINYNGHITKLIDSRIWLTPDGDYYPPDTIHEQYKKESPYTSSNSDNSDSSCSNDSEELSYRIGRGYNKKNKNRIKTNNDEKEELCINLCTIM